MFQNAADLCLDLLDRLPICSDVDPVLLLCLVLCVGAAFCFEFAKSLVYFSLKVNSFESFVTEAGPLRNSFRTNINKED